MKALLFDRRELLARMRYWPPELRVDAAIMFCHKHDLRIRWWWVRDKTASFGLFTVGVVLLLVVPDAPELTVETPIGRRVSRWKLRETLEREAAAPT